MSRFASRVVLIAAGLLLCACAKPGHPATPLTDAPPSVGVAAPTGIPSDAPWPSPFPSATLAGEPLTHTLAVTERGLPRAAGRMATNKPSSAADLAIQVPGPVQIIPGETAAYTLTVRNHGPGPATGIVLTDVLPQGVTPIWTRPAHPWCERQGREVSCDAGDLQGGDAITVTLDLSTASGTSPMTGTQTPGVTLDLAASTCTIDRDSVPSRVTCHLSDLPPGAEAQVRIGVEVDVSIVGSPVHTATVAANEADPDRANNRAAGTMTAGTAGPVAAGEATPTVDLVVRAEGPESVFAGRPFTYTFTVINQGTLAASGVHLEDVLPPDLDLVAYAPGLPLCEQGEDRLTCFLGDPDSGETITFTLVITGHAGQPMHMAPDPVRPGWPMCSVLKERTWLHIVNCELGVLQPGQAIRVQLTLVAIGVLPRTTANTVSVSAREAERDLLDNTATATITVNVKADLLLQSVISGPALPGKALSYTLTVSNMGPSDAGNVVLTDTLPMGTRLVSATPSQGHSCRVERGDSSPDTVICSLGQLGGGRTATVTIVVAVEESLTPASARALIHSARVIAGPADPNHANNELMEAIPVSTNVEESP